MSSILLNQCFRSYVPVKLSRLSIGEIGVRLSNGDAKQCEMCYQQSLISATVVFQIEF